MRRAGLCLLLFALLAPRADADATGTFTLGGPERDHGFNVATDGAGNLFVVGSFKGTVDFDPGPGVVEHTAGDDGRAPSPIRGRMDAFVVKYDAEGKLAWHLVLGGSGVNLAQSIAVDELGGVAIAGQFSGLVDFDPADPPDEADTLESGIGRNAFVARYDDSGAFLWVVGIGDDDVAPRGSRELPVEWSEGIRDVVIADDGRVYVAGMFRGRVDMDPGEEVVSRASFEGSRDAFLACYDAEGRYVWDVVVGGKGMDQGHAVALGPGGRVALGGVFEDVVDFDLGAGERLAASAGGWDVFVATWDEDRALRDVWTWGGKQADQIGSSALAFDASGAIYAAGSFNGRIDFDPGRKRRILESSGESDAFLVRYTADGKLDWALTFGGSREDRALDLVRTRSGHVVVCGRFRAEADFDPGRRKRTLEASGTAGASDAFVACYDPKGRIRWAQAIGAPISGARYVTAAWGLARGPGDQVVVVGTYFGQPELGERRESFVLPNAGSSDVFVVRYDAKGKVVP